MSASIAFGTGKVPEDLTTYGAWARQVESSGFSMVVAGRLPVTVGRPLSHPLSGRQPHRQGAAGHHRHQPRLPATRPRPPPPPWRSNKSPVGDSATGSPRATARCSTLGRSRLRWTTSGTTPRRSGHSATERQPAGRAKTCTCGGVPPLSRCGSPPRGPAPSTWPDRLPTG